MPPTIFQKEWLYLWVLFFQSKGEKGIILNQVIIQLVIVAERMSKHWQAQQRRFTCEQYAFEHELVLRQMFDFCIMFVYIYTLKSVRVWFQCAYKHSNVQPYFFYCSMCEFDHFRSHVYSLIDGLDETDKISFLSEMIIVPPPASICSKHIGILGSIHFGTFVFVFKSMNWIWTREKWNITQ